VSQASCQPGRAVRSTSRGRERTHRGVPREAGGTRTAHGSCGPRPGRYGRSPTSSGWRRAPSRCGYATSSSTPRARRSTVTRRRPRGPDHPLRRRKLAQLDQLRTDGPRTDRQPDRPRVPHGGSRPLRRRRRQGRHGRPSSPTRTRRFVAFFCAWLRGSSTSMRAAPRDPLPARGARSRGGVPALGRRHGSAGQRQFSQALSGRAADPSIRSSKHAHGCAHVGYSCSVTQRTILALTGRWWARVTRDEVGLRGWDSNPQTFRLTADCSAS
jgi:hypothetical protein